MKAAGAIAERTGPPPADASTVARYVSMRCLGSATDMVVGVGIFSINVARYRVRRDARALNEIRGTTFFLFTASGCPAYGTAAGVAVRVNQLLHQAPDQGPTAYDRLRGRCAFHPINARGCPRIEIDFPEEHWRAGREVLPVDAVDEQRGRLLDVVRAGGSRRTRYHV